MDGIGFLICIVEAVAKGCELFKNRPGLTLAFVNFNTMIIGSSGSFFSSSTITSSSPSSPSSPSSSNLSLFPFLLHSLPSPLCAAKMT